jgi:hypothetical protein
MSSLVFVSHSADSKTKCLLLLIIFLHNHQKSKDFFYLKKEQKEKKHFISTMIFNIPMLW